MNQFIIKQITMEIRRYHRQNYSESKHQFDLWCSTIANRLLVNISSNSFLWKSRESRWNVCPVIFHLSRVFKQIGIVLGFPGRNIFVFTFFSKQMSVSWFPKIFSIKRLISIHGRLLAKVFLTTGKFPVAIGIRKQVGFPIILFMVLLTVLSFWIFDAEFYFWSNQEIQDILLIYF